MQLYPTLAEWLSLANVSQLLASAITTWSVTWDVLSSSVNVQYLLGAAGLVVAFWIYSRKVREELRVERADFEKYFSIVNPRSLRRESDLTQLTEDFFTGRDIERNCLRYVALNLDAPRRELRRTADLMLNAHRLDRLFVIEVLGPPQEGKTLFLSRLAYDAASRRHLFGCRRTIVAWAKHPAANAMKNPTVIKAFCRQVRIAGLFPRPLILFIDDPVQPPSSELSAHELKSVSKEFLETLGDEEVHCVVASRIRLFPNRTNVARLMIGNSDALSVSEEDATTVSVSEEDAESIIDRWQRFRVMPTETANQLRAELRTCKHYRKNLFSFLSILYEHAARTPKHEFLKKFEQEFYSVANPHNSLLPIAACGVLNVDLPASVLSHMAGPLQMHQSIAIPVRLGAEKGSEGYRMYHST